MLNLSRKFRYSVELHSTEPQAVESTRQTIEAIFPLGAKLEQNAFGFVLIGTDFHAYACEHQGYVKKVNRPGAPVIEEE